MRRGVTVGGRKISATLSAGEHLLHCRLIEEIGAGGMGAVWRALDTRLHRDVALKLLPPERLSAQFGALYLQTGRYREAEEVLKRSIALKPSAVAYNNLSSCYTYQEKFADAVPPMEKALQMGQSSVTLLGNLAHLYRLAPGFESKAGKAYRQAFEEARKELAINPSDAEVRADLAWLYAETGDRKAAEREIGAARLQAPANPAVLFREVLVYERVGQRGQALAAFESLAKTGSYLEEVSRRPELKAFRNDPKYKERKWRISKSK